MRLFILFLFCITANFANAAGLVGSSIIEPTYEGYVSKTGDLEWAATDGIAAPFVAHKYCDSAFSGSRAAEYEDFKYIYASLPAGNYFVMNPFTSRTGSGPYIYLAKTGEEFTYTETEADMFCKGYTDATSSYTTIVLDTSIHGLKKVGCDQTIRIACVKD